MNSLFHLTLNSTESLIDNRISGNIQSGISFLKDGLNDAIDKTSECFSNHFVAPVNNFIKDFTQMEKEFKQLQKAEHEFSICLNGTYITASDVLRMPMEENY